MELIVKIPDEDYKYICKIAKDLKGRAVLPTDWKAIAHGTPYSPSGDCISRSDLKKEVVGMMINKADDLEEIEFEINATLASICEKIDNAPPVPERTKGESISLELAKEVIAKFKGYLDDDMIERIQIALKKESEAENGTSN